MTSVSPGEQCLGKEGSRVSLGRDINRGLPRSGRGRTSLTSPTCGRLSPTLGGPSSTLGRSRTPPALTYNSGAAKSLEESLCPLRRGQARRKRRKQIFSQIFGAQMQPPLTEHLLYSVRSISPSTPASPCSWNMPAQSCLRAPALVPQPGGPFPQSLVRLAPSYGNLLLNIQNSASWLTADITRGA